jgi:hypothetical protein
LENIWNAAHLPPTMLPEPPTAEKALKAAVREATVGGAASAGRTALSRA